MVKEGVERHWQVVPPNWVANKDQIIELRMKRWRHLDARAALHIELF